MSVWNFHGIDTNEFTHGFHLYPARLNPHVARRLIKQHGREASTLWDPFAGSGTSLVEGRLSGLNVFGNDINPTALQISLAKCQNYDREDLEKHVESILSGIDSIKLLPLKKSIARSGFNEKEIHSWFAPKNVMEIATAFDLIDKVSKTIGSTVVSTHFTRMCLSDCIRTVSFQREKEWKLYRKKDWRIGRMDDSLYQPLFPIFGKKIQENVDSVLEFNDELRKRKCQNTSYHVSKADCARSTHKIQRDSKGVDIVLTSPPYGDSPTTMAYEQFSWLPNKWLGLDRRSPGKLAKEMLGGIKAKSVEATGHGPIDKAISKIEAKKQADGSPKDQEKRTKDLRLKNYSFYRDYLKSIENISSVVNPNGKVCFVLGNRISGGQEMRMDLFTDWAFRNQGFEKVGRTKKREIPNTRMPKSNPSGSTMNNEYIVVYKKQE